MKKIGLMVVCAATLAGLAGCKSVECGTGTSEVDGECVADAANNGANNGGTNNGGTNNGGSNNGGSNNGGGEVTCGAGTVLDGSQCIVSDPTTCGAGTQLDANSGECVVTDVVCGTGTAFDGTSCLPTDVVCAMGTFFDDAMAMCMPEASCLPGDTIVDGFCMGPVETLIASADLFETENNDAELGGAPETFTLAAEGTPFVLAGDLNAPADLDNDGEDDQDVDMFTFEATAGQWISIELMPTSGEPMGFFVVGPNDYFRDTVRGASYGAAREFVVAETGTHTLVIAPTVTMGPNGIRRDVLAGDGTTQWAANVEVRPAPQAMAVDLTMPVQGVSVDTRSNFFTDMFPAGNLVRVRLDQLGPFGTHELIFFDGANVVQRSRAGFNGVTTTVPSSGALSVVVDWIEAEIDSEFEISAIDAGTSTDLGVVGSGATVTASVADLQPMDSSFFTFNVAPGHILELTQTSDQAAPLDVFVSQGGTNLFQGFIEPPGGFGPKFGYVVGAMGGGDFLVEIRSDFSARTNVALNITALSPTDLGTLNDGDTVMQMDATPLAASQSAFMVGTLSAESYLTGALDGGGADIDLRVLDTSGNTLQFLGTPGGETFSWLVPAGTYVFEVDGFQAAPNGWTFDMTVGSFNAVQEVEPNDDSTMASPGLTLSDQATGTLDTGDSDWWSFTVATAGVYTFEATPASAGFFAADMFLNNTADETIASFSGFGTEAITTFLEPGTYTLGLVAVDPNPLDYIVNASMSPSGADLDDAGANDTSATAQAAAIADGYSIAGVLSGSTDEDWFVFDLAAATSFNFGGASGLTVTFYDAAMQAIAPAGFEIGLPMGMSYMSVTGFVDGGPNDYAITFALPAANSKSSTPALAIPDNGFFTNMVATDTIAVMGMPCTLASLEVTIDITHTWRGDLRVTLETPDGTALTLWEGGGGSEDDLIGTFPTTLTPVTDLSTVVGESAVGDWILTVGDAGPMDVGTLNAWGIAYNCQ